MKILHFYKTYLPDTIGGTEQVINQIARSTTNMGVTTEVLSLSPIKVDRTVEVDGHLVHRCLSNFEIASTPISVSAFLRFRQLAAKADIIHYHFPYPFTDVLHLLSNIKKPTLVTYHSDIIKQKKLLKIYKPLMSYFLSSVDHIVATSPQYIETSKILSRYKNKVSVIPIGLDKDSYPKPSVEKLNHWRKRFSERFFLFVGVIRYYKGIYFLIEAARNSEYPIVIVGTGRLAKELEKLSFTLGVKNIHFVGQLSNEDKVALFELSYAFVFPSHLRSEAFGISLLEAAMYGKPLISCELGTGTSFVNKNNLTGIVVPPADPTSLRNAMDYLWNNREVAAEMGKQAEKRYLELFSAVQMGQSYVKLYKKLLGVKYSKGHSSTNSTLLEKLSD